MISHDLIKGFDERFGRLERSQVKYRQGVVATSDPLTIRLGGSSVAVSAVALDSAGTLAVDAVVAVASFGNDLIVLGPIASGAALVTALPTTPYEGQQIRYRAAAGVIWDFRYDDATGYWEFVGGPSLTSTNTTNGTVASSSTTAFSNTPSITAPFGGDYEVVGTGDWYTSDSTKQGNVQAGNGSVFTSVHRNGWTVNNSYMPMVLSGVLTGFPAASQIRLYGFTSGGVATLTATTKVLSVRPQRIA